MKCSRHPKIETNLRCGKCDRPICPKCTIQTPVGARCPECAKLNRLPTFKVSPLDYAKAATVGIALAAGLGIGWEKASSHMDGFSFLGILIAAWVIADLMGRAINKKRSRGLQIAAGICIGICYGTAVAFGLPVTVFNLLSLAAGVVIAAGMFR